MAHSWLETHDSLFLQVEHGLTEHEGFSMQERIEVTFQDTTHLAIFLHGKVAIECALCTCR